MGQIDRILQRLLILPVKGYQWLIRPLLGPCCRFYPSCSEYTIQAIEIHGVVKGIQLACCRLLRCHPWREGGFDPVKSITNTNDFKKSNYEKF